MESRSSRITRFFQTTALVLLMVQLTGCATIFTGTNDTITFDANVPGVQLTIDGLYKGELPLTLKISRNFMNGQQFKAKFEKEGFETQEFQLQREFNYVAVLDITSVLTSGGIDVLTGALMKFSPTEYHVDLKESRKRADAPDFERSKFLYGYALRNYRNLQLDIARGQGEYLSAFISAVSNREDSVGTAMTRQTLHHTAALLDAPTAHDFVRRFNTVLADDPRLRGYQL